MAFITANVYSKVLQQSMTVDLFLPNDRQTLPLQEPKAVVYFLHGLGSSEKEFREYTATNRYARENHIAMVYPSAPHGFYNDMKYGFKYFTYLTEELPLLLKSLFGLNFTRDKTFVAGLSMGGYGALKLGLSRPDIYGALAEFSGACDIKWMADVVKKDPNPENAVFIPVFGENIEIDDTQDPFYLASSVSKLSADEQPRIFMACGKQDDLFDLYNQNIRLKNHMETLPLKEFKYMEWNGIHDYNFWDRAMLHAIAFFLENDYDKKVLDLWRCD